MTINEAKKVIESHYDGFVANRVFLCEGRYYFNLVDAITNKVPLLGGVPYVDQKTGKVGILDIINPGETFDFVKFRKASSNPILFK